MYHKVTELYRRSGTSIAEYTYVTLSGGFSDEAQWSYHTVSWTLEELAPIEAALTECMNPTDKRTWHISRFSDGCSASGRANLDGFQVTTPEGLAQKLREFYQRQNAR